MRNSPINPLPPYQPNHWIPFRNTPLPSLKPTTLIRRDTNIPPAARPHSTHTSSNTVRACRAGGQACARRLTVDAESRVVGNRGADAGAAGAAGGERGASLACAGGEGAGAVGAGAGWALRVHVLD